MSAWNLKRLASAACLATTFCLTSFADAAIHLPSNVVTAALFEWKFDSIARECTSTLGPKGYTYVQVSPPSEHVGGSEWWTSYQPVSYKIASRRGDRASFKRMIDTCHAAGVKVMADTVINHMSNRGSGTGTGGSSFTKYNYPGLYSDQDFHTCRQPIGNNYADRSNVQNCELEGLADLNTGSAYVRGKISAYMNDLISLGVDAFRVDAVKHILASELAGVRSGLSDQSFPWVQEAINGAGEAVSPSEYLGIGSVQEFRYARDLKRIFQTEKLAYLKNFGEAWGYMAGGQSAVFVTNHDTERNGETLTYKDNSIYTLAHVFMLAHPYGSPAVHSGYEFTDKNTGAPSGGTVNACYSDGWRCQHAWRPIANMVKLRTSLTNADTLNNWWDNQNNQIAFGRGNKAFVVINKEGGSLTQTFTTSLPAGTYCDIQHGDITAAGACTGATYTVGNDGKFTATVGPNDAIALYAKTAVSGATTQPPVTTTTQPPVTTTTKPPVGTTTGASFNVNAQTVLGENIFVIGSIPALGSWAPANAVALSSASYPVWKKDVAIAAGTAFEYKYIKKNGAGQVVWESGANRAGSIPAAGGQVAMNDSFRA